MTTSGSSFDPTQLIDGATGTGNLVLQTSPTLITPALGVATADSLASAGAVSGTTGTFTGAITGASTTVTAGLGSSGPTGAGIGYRTGAGGTVSQGTDRTTTVVLSKLSGQITTQATSLAAQTSVAFTVTNTTVAIGDTVIVAIQSGPTGLKTVAHVTTVAAGSFVINLFNTDASVADTGAAIINFAVIKAVAA